MYRRLVVATVVYVIAMGASLSQLWADDPSSEPTAHEVWTDCGATALRLLSLHAGVESPWTQSVQTDSAIRRRDRSLSEVFDSARRLYPDSTFANVSLANARDLPLPLIAFIRAPGSAVGHFLTIWDVRGEQGLIVEDGTAAQWADLSQIASLQGGPLILIRSPSVLSPGAMAFILGLLTGVIASSVARHMYHVRKLRQCALTALALATVGLSACGAPEPPGVRVVGDPQLNLGIVPANEPSQRAITFTLKNTAQVAVTATSVVTSCGCSSARLEPSTIQPDGEATLHCRIELGEGRETASTIQVHFDHGVAPVGVQVSGFKRATFLYEVLTKSLPICPGRVGQVNGAPEARIDIRLPFGEADTLDETSVAAAAWSDSLLAPGVPRLTLDSIGRRGEIAVPLIPSQAACERPTPGVLTVKVMHNGSLRTIQAEIGVRCDPGLTCDKDFVGPESRGARWGMQIRVQPSEDVEPTDVTVLSIPPTVRLADGFPARNDDRSVVFRFEPTSLRAGGTRSGVLTIGSSRQPWARLTLPVAP